MRLCCFFPRCCLANPSNPPKKVVISVLEGWIIQKLVPGKLGNSSKSFKKYKCLGRFSPTNCLMSIAIATFEIGWKHHVFGGETLSFTPQPKTSRRARRWRASVSLQFGPRLPRGRWRGELDGLDIDIEKQITGCRRHITSKNLETHSPPKKQTRSPKQKLVTSHVTSKQKKNVPSQEMFLAHSVILVARSDFFRAAFSSDSGGSEGFFFGSTWGERYKRS